MLSLPRYAVDVGDRAPNFILPDQFGQPFNFYTQLKGGATILFFCSGLESDDQLQAFVRRAEQFAEKAVNVIVIRGEIGLPAAAVGPSQAAPFPILTDHRGDVAGAFRAVRKASAEIRGDRRTESDREAFVTFILDPNQRVLKVTTRADGQHAEVALRSLERLDYATEAASRAPVLLIPNVLDRTYCQELIALWKSDNVEGMISYTAPDGTMDNRPNPSRRCRDHIIHDTPLNQKIVTIVGRRLRPEILKAFCFDVRHYEPFYIVGYDAERGDFFRPHRDNMSPAKAHRRFAMTLNLNTGAYEGGGVRFLEYSPDVYQPEAGGAVIFSCSLLHEAVPVSKGVRYILSGFMWGEQDEQARQRLMQQGLNSIASGQMQGHPTKATDS